ncbi:MAG TPA: hypothetical protein VH369_15375 [Bryobacteraceae bacterium]|jgi:hypothetical protein
MQDLPWQSRVLKIFVASPNDVTEERDALARLIRDINDVLAFLAPESRLTLELVRYETHTSPDIGRPQEVINRQIAPDYDIFVGVMWRRTGTPTATDASGTIEEFRRAYERRKHGHLPRIMFYFCDQPIAIPDAAELEQLAGVVKFREELSKLGLTGAYPSHADFAEYVRGGLLRAIRDLLQEESRSPRSGELEVRGESIDSAANAELLQLAAEYEEIRRKLPSGGPRTRRMTAVFSRMKAKAPGARALLDEFEKSESPGIRLAAIAILQMFPNADHLDWLARRLDNPGMEKPFVGYQAAVALLDAVQALPSEECGRLKAALEKALALAQTLPEDSDRLDVLAMAQQEFSRRCDGVSSR